MLSIYVTLERGVLGFISHIPSRQGYLVNFRLELTKLKSRGVRSMQDVRATERFFQRDVLFGLLGVSSLHV